MNQLFNDLQSILASELALHEQLLAATGEMNAALLAHRTADVARCTARCDSLTCQVENLEEKRIAASDRLGDAIGCRRRPATIRQIIAQLPSDQAAPLSDLRQRLRNVLGELDRLTCSNRILLESGLRFIGKAFEIIASNCSKTTGYHARGTEARTSINLAVVNRVA